MTTFEQLKAVALGQLGYIETPSNITKYWAELDPGLQGQPWCAAYVSWVFKHAGVPLPAMDRAYGYMNVASARNYAQAHRLFSSSGHYAPGDIVLFGAGGTVHTGIILSDDGTTMVTIEGNTSPTEWGSQTNGGMVATRRRAHGPWVYGVLQSSKWLTAAPTRTAPVTVSRSVVRKVIAVIKAVVTRKPTRVLLAVDGDFGPATRKRLQQWASVVPDGVLGYNSWRHIQIRVGTTPTGSPNRNTWVHLQRLIGARQDGDFGPLSVKALQRYLNTH